ncbi:MAG TPA: hypothetical protein VGS03_17855 [Candidatus Polarisedimenticolia bacterium]|nr:hypothetical protein [Candidatus Polarisedimenticolia bacterium]
MWTARVSLAGLMLGLVATWSAGGTSQGAAKAAGTVPGKVTPASALHFIQDDSSAALAEAKRRGVPIFVEAWAPW